MSKFKILNDIRQLNDKDLTLRIAEEKSRYSKMKHMHAVTPLESSIVIRNLRRDIARMIHEIETRKMEDTNA